jgi:hypothetical protein
MQILKSLKELFPDIQAYVPGYAPMLEMLKKGRSHSAEMANKHGQVDPKMTGCAYADSQLLPAIREYQGFVDQEAITTRIAWEERIYKKIVQRIDGFDGFFDN